jgi:hypothetical protein
MTRNVPKVSTRSASLAYVLLESQGDARQCVTGRRQREDQRPGCEVDLSERARFRRRRERWQRLLSVQSSHRSYTDLSGAICARKEQNINAQRLNIEPAAKAIPRLQLVSMRGRLSEGKCK